MKNGGYYISSEEYRTAHIRKQNPCFVYDGRASRNRSPLCLLPFLDFLWKVRHAVFRLIIFMQEQSYKNEGGIYSNLWKVHTRKSHTAQRYVTPRPTVNEIQVQHIVLNLNRHYRGRLVEHDRRQVGLSAARYRCFGVEGASAPSPFDWTITIFLGCSHWRPP